MNGSLTRRASKGRTTDDRPLTTDVRHVLSFFCAKPDASGVVMKTENRWVFARNSLTIRQLDSKIGSSPSRGSERLMKQGDRYRPRDHCRLCPDSARYPLAEERANRYSARVREGGSLPRHLRRGPIEACPAKAAISSSLTPLPRHLRRGPIEATGTFRWRRPRQSALPRHLRRGPIEA
jgi:hypothetical protein